jgi:hypothetical protein
MSKLWWWFKTLLSSKPHFIIGGSDPYLYRWYLIPRNNKLNVYLHRFYRDDDDRALHDHPWWFISWMLWGGYFEVTPEGLRNRRWLSVAYRPAIYQHRVVLRRQFPHFGLMRSCWTLVITGPKRRTWGFWCPKGFVPWHEFVDGNDAGNVGRGCGEN